MRIKKLLFVLMLINVFSVHGQNYSCTFLKLIISEMQKRGDDYNIYSAVMTSKIKAVKTELKTSDKLRMKDKIMDSLRQCCHHAGFFDDSLFHMKGEILLVDTFNFFNGSCFYNKQFDITIENNPIDLSCISKNNNVVIVQSIRVYNSNFIITLKHFKTDSAVDFKFTLIANHSPILSEVERWYLE